MVRVSRRVGWETDLLAVDPQRPIDAGVSVLTDGGGYRRPLDQQRGWPAGTSANHPLDSFDPHPQKVLVGTRLDGVNREGSHPASAFLGRGEHPLHGGGQTDRTQGTNPTLVRAATPASSWAPLSSRSRRPTRRGGTGKCTRRRRRVDQPGADELRYGRTVAETPSPNHAEAHAVTPS